MKKPAVTQVPICPMIAHRWSPRAFSPRAIPREQIVSLLEAVRWAASSRNEQPWELILATRDNAAEFEPLLNCLVPGNIVWAKDAPLLILMIAKRNGGDGHPNKYAFHDVGFAVACLTLQAQTLDLWVHQMGGFDTEKARVTFAIPADRDPVSVLAVGSYGDPSTLPENRRQQETGPRSRKPLGEFVFAAKFGTSAQL